jgi:hypothetical protein
MLARTCRNLPPENLVRAAHPHATVESQSLCRQIARQVLTTHRLTNQIRQLHSADAAV